MIITGRERAVLEAFLWKVRLATLDQVARAWWEAGRDNARRRLGGLARAGLLFEERIPVRPVSKGSETPLFRWEPGETPPDFEALAWRFKRRWRDPLEVATVYGATQLAIRRMGGVTPGKIKALGQASHDVHLAEVYFGMLRRDPALAAAWRGEDEVAPSRAGQKLPDAILCDPEGRPLRAIEFGGGYPAARIREFHDDCAARGLPYEFW